MLAYTSRARSKVARTTGARVSPRTRLCRAAAPRAFGERHANELDLVVFTPTALQHQQLERKNGIS
eukprot:19981-Heterococcus_DN1.PRE.2